MNRFVGSVVLSVSFLLLMSGCSKERRAWEGALELGDKPALQAFLAEFPEGILADSARLRIQELDYLGAMESATIGAFEDFLAAYPDGGNADAIRDALEARYPVWDLEDAIDSGFLTLIMEGEESGANAHLRLKNEQDRGLRVRIKGGPTTFSIPNTSIGFASQEDLVLAFSEGEERELTLPQAGRGRVTAGSAEFKGRTISFNNLAITVGG